MYETEARPQVEKYYGKYPAVVLNNAPETEGSHRGELLVQVPGLLEEADEAGETQQGMQVVAKPCFPAGFFFLPEVGEQVWVEFAAGDINEPIWSGRWYPSEETPATVAGEPPTAAQKVIRTASGHVVQLDDTEDEEKIVVRHTTGSFVSIDAAGTIIIGAHPGSSVVLNTEEQNLIIVDEHANSIQLTESGIVILKNPGDAGVELSEDLVRLAAKTVALQGEAVTAGGGNKPVLATQNALQFAAMWALFKQHFHPTGVGPSGPPQPMPPDIEVSTVMLVE